MNFQHPVAVVDLWALSPDRYDPLLLFRCRFALGGLPLLAWTPPRRAINMVSSMSHFRNLLFLVLFMLLFLFYQLDIRHAFAYVVFSVALLFPSVLRRR